MSPELEVGSPSAFCSLPSPTTLPIFFSPKNLTSSSPKIGQLILLFYLPLPFQYSLFLP